MNIDKATAAKELLDKIAEKEYLLNRFKEEREARLTGLDPNCCGAKNHVISAISDVWKYVGEWCVDFFITAFDALIHNTDKELSDLKKELEEL